jgi:hypothetical protein
MGIASADDGGRRSHGGRRGRGGTKRKRVRERERISVPCHRDDLVIAYVVVTFIDTPSEPIPRCHILLAHIPT